MGGFEAWLRGSNTYFDADTNSEVDTGVSDSAPATIAEPSDPNGWLAVSVWGFYPEDKDEGTGYETPAGDSFDDPRIREHFTLELLPLNRTDDASTITALREHLSKRYLYIAVKTYDETLHNTNHCIAVKREWKKESKDKANQKVYTLELSKRVLS